MPGSTESKQKERLELINAYKQVLKLALKTSASGEIVDNKITL